MTADTGTPPWCTCRNDGKWRRTDGWTQDLTDNTKVRFVHNRCGRPSKMYVERIEGHA